MADDNKEKDQDDNVAVAESEAAGEGDAEGDADSQGGDSDDLMDLFDTDDVVVDEALAMLVASLSDIDINELMEQVRDIQEIVRQIHDR